MGRILAVIGILFVVIIVGAVLGAFLWWQHYKTTPAYSIALLVDAAQRNDTVAVEKIVDTDKIVDNFSTQVTEKAAGRYGAALSNSVRKQIEALVPSLLPALKQQVRDGVAARVKEISQNADKKPFIVVALAVPYVVNITTEGDKAKASAVIREQQVELELQRDGDAWKVVAVHDDALLQRIVDEVIKGLPAIGAGDELDLRKQLKKLPRGLPPFPGLR